MTSIICSLVLISAVSLDAQPASPSDSLLNIVRNLYEHGSYLSSEVEARRLLDNRFLPDSSRIVAEQYLAFSLVAQAKNADAAEHFATILMIDSTFTLDPVLTSPKILSVFVDARRQFRNLKPLDPSRSASPSNSSAQGATFRTVLFPGWEQAFQGRTIKGYSLMGAGILSLGATFYFDVRRRSAKEDYLAANTPELVASTYTRYNNFHKAEYYSLAAFLAIYVYSQLDAFLDLPPHLDPTIFQTRSSVQLTMHVQL